MYGVQVRGAVGHSSKIITPYQHDSLHAVAFGSQRPRTEWRQCHLRVKDQCEASAVPSAVDPTLGTCSPVESA